MDQKAVVCPTCIIPPVLTISDLTVGAVTCQFAGVSNDEAMFVNILRLIGRSRLVSLPPQLDSIQ